MMRNTKNISSLNAKKHGFMFMLGYFSSEVTEEKLCNRLIMIAVVWIRSTFNGVILCHL